MTQARARTVRKAPSSSKPAKPKAASAKPPAKKTPRAKATAKRAEAAPAGPKKVARKVGEKPFPIGSALRSRLEKKGMLRLVLASARGGKFTEIAVDTEETTVREGKLGTAGRISKKLKLSRYAGESWALRTAKALLAKGYLVDGVVIEPDVLARWRIEVDRIGMRTRGWDIESERIFVR